MLATAVSFQQPDTLSFYNFVIFIHITAAIVAFGVTFAYPLIDVALHRPGNRQHLAWWYRIRAQLSRWVITLAATVLLLAGIYLAAAGTYKFKSTFVTIGLVIIIVILGLAGGFITPTERKLADLAERDIAAAGGGEVKLSAGYTALAGRLRMVDGIVGLLVLVAVFLMVVKPA
jgi:uncharacterized membrane protein